MIGAVAIRAEPSTQFELRLVRILARVKPVFARLPDVDQRVDNGLAFWVVNVADTSKGAPGGLPHTMAPFGSSGASGNRMTLAA